MYLYNKINADGTLQYKAFYEWEAYYGAEHVAIITGDYKEIKLVRDNGETFSMKLHKENKNIVSIGNLAPEDSQALYIMMSQNKKCIVLLATFRNIKLSRNDYRTADKGLSDADKIQLISYGPVKFTNTAIDVTTAKKGME